MAWRRIILPFIFLIFCSVNAQIPHIILGYVYYDDEPAKDINITLFNEDRKEKIVVKTDKYGFYFVDVGYVNGWRAGEKIIIFANDKSQGITLILNNKTHQWANITLNKNGNRVIDFYYSPSNPSDIDEINFFIVSNVEIINYTWHFGDGAISHEKNPKHKYEDDGNYTVTLFIKDANGFTTKISKSINVKNCPPIPDFSWHPSHPKINEEVHFTANSTDVDGYIVNYTWNFGDETLYGKEVYYKFNMNGKYKVKLLVRDDDGAIAEKEKIIEILANKTPSFEVITVIMMFLLLILIKAYKNY